MKQKIIKVLAKATNLPEEKIQLEIPENEKFGDYSSNIAMKLFSESKKNLKLKILNLRSPAELAQYIIEKIKVDKDLLNIVDHIDVADPGFINFWLKKEVLFDNLTEISNKKEIYGRTNLLKGKKYLLEHTSPNTIKTLHVGHVRNNVLGMAVHNIMEFTGAKVTLDAINNDRGIHVMKAVWAYMKFGKGKTPKSENQKPDHFVDRFYLMGAMEADIPETKEEMQELLRRWEAEDKKVRDVWKKLRDWTFEGFEQTYIRLGSNHDHQWFESDFYEHGKEIVEEGLKKHVFRKLEDGAILSDLEKYGLSDAIVLRADGTSMYHTQDLFLTKLKREKFQSDSYIWDIGPEQNLYLKQLFAMCEQLGIGKIDDYFHLSYGFVYLKGGQKMSSRAGNVVSADWLLDEVVKRTLKIIEKSKTSRGLSAKEKIKVAEIVGLGAIKYGFLKLARTTDLQFDIDESLSLEGNSGPYIQYTFARTQSVLRKAQLKTDDLRLITNNKLSVISYKLNSEEILLLRSFIHFPEVIEESVKNYAPNLICNYLYDLAQKFNLFYAKNRILGLEDKKSKDIRVFLTVAAGQVLKNGLGLLGIQAPEKM